MYKIGCREGVKPEMQSSDIYDSLIREKPPPRAVEQLWRAAAGWRPCAGIHRPPELT